MESSWLLPVRRWLVHGLMVMLSLSIPCTLSSQTFSLAYAPTPVDNPLKGLVPYAGEQDRFPHSMEFSYLALSDLMVGPSEFDWKPLESLLNQVAGRRHQLVVRVWVEYPGKNGIPAFLVDNGLKVTRWVNQNTAPLPAQTCWTPDYQDPLMRNALVRFIHAFGKKYDGDPRLAYVTAGLLGTWGEWHSHPRPDLFASKQVQAEVLDAYEKAFKTTRVLLRYPANDQNERLSPNHLRPFGYHDDSFAWATLDTDQKQDRWFFVPALRSAGALDKWKTQPIGGEIRPELWGQIFDEVPAHPKAQNFSRCVHATHATWLMDSGMFEKRPSQERVAMAKQLVARLGYEFHISKVNLQKAGETTSVSLTVENTGVAPFYYDWKVQLGAWDGNRVTTTWATPWKVTGLLPTETRKWQIELNTPANTQFAVRVLNPLKNGKPLRFANAFAFADSQGWLPLVKSKNKRPQSHQAKTGSAEPMVELGDSRLQMLTKMSLAGARDITDTTRWSLAQSIGGKQETVWWLTRDNTAIGVLLAIPLRDNGKAARTKWTVLSIHVGEVGKGVDNWKQQRVQVVDGR